MRERTKLTLGRIEGDKSGYMAGIEQELTDGFTIQQAAEIQKADGISDDEAFVMKGKKTVFLGPIKFVHQLQNLYFALTGKELETKQPAPSHNQ